jgi:aldose 1-epimerase
MEIQGMKLAVIGVIMATAIAASAQVTSSSFGKAPDGTPVEIYVLKSAQVEARVITWGARLISVRTPDRNGKVADIVLGYDTLPEWLADTKTHFGGVVGRYGNRIAKGRFTLDGKEYQIPVNNNGNALHGGTVGFDQKFWTAKAVPHGVELTLVSQDGDMGFPGTLHAKVTYTLVGAELTIHYEETTDKPTVVNLTNHSYFNLAGDDSRDVLDHKVTLHADSFTPTDAGLIPTGVIAPVAGTPLDFRTPHTVGERIGADNEQLKMAGGYDQNWVLNGKSGELREAARVEEPTSGRTLTVSTTEPGIQFYSGNFLDGTFVGRHQVRYVKHMGLCLETQHFPDSPNHSDFPSTVIRPGEVRKSTTVFAFGISH